MSKKYTTRIRDSIATQLLTIVFSLYLTVAATVTLSHIIVEYNRTKDNIMYDIKIFHKTFARGLAIASYNLDEDSLYSILRGIMEIPIIVGVKVADLDGETIGIIGLTKDSEGAILSYDNQGKQQPLTQTTLFSSLFEYEFPLVFTTPRGHQIKAGKCTFYSSTSFVLDRVKYGLLFILGNAIVKTIALWIIFLLVSRFVLSRPLSKLTMATEKLNLDDPKLIEIEFKSSRYNELEILTNALNAMIRKNVKLFQSLGESEKKYRTLTENLNVGIYRSALDPQGKILYSNVAAVQMLGYTSKEEFNSKPVFEFYFSPNDREQLLEELQRQGKCKSFEVQLKKKNNDLIWCSINATIQYDEVEDTQWIDGVIEDITKRKEAEFLLRTYNEKLERKVQERTKKLQDTVYELKEKHYQLQNTQTQLVQSEKMASLGIMVAGAAHELNNPNNFVYVGISNLKSHLNQFQEYFFELLEDESDSVRLSFQKQLSPVFEDMEMIRQGSQRIQIIVKGLRMFSLLDGGEKKSFQITEGLRWATSIMQANYQEQVKFSYSFQELPLLDCWPAELNQAFVHILQNACQAILTKLKETKDTTQGQVDIITSVKNGFVEIRFQDTGCGISPDIQDKVFDPFFTTKEVGQGTGLGLSSVYGIMQKHKGTITIDSKVGESTTVTLTLPCS